MAVAGYMTIVVIGNDLEIWYLVVSDKWDILAADVN